MSALEISPTAAPVVFSCCLLLHPGYNCNFFAEHLCRCVYWTEFLFQIQRGSVQSFSSFASVITWSVLLRNDLTKPNSTAVTDSPSLHLLPSWLHLMSTHSARRCSVDKENSSGGPVCEICDILPTTTALITGGGWLKGRWKISSPGSSYRRVSSITGRNNTAQKVYWFKIMVLSRLQGEMYKWLSNCLKGVRLLDIWQYRKCFLI